MDIGWFRDLIICVSGVVVTGVCILIAVLGYSFYRKTRSILDSVEGISATIDELATYVGDEVVKPVIQATALARGIRQGIDAISSFFRK